MFILLHSDAFPKRNRHSCTHLIPNETLNLIFTKPTETQSYFIFIFFLTLIIIYSLTLLFPNNISFIYWILIIILSNLTNHGIFYLTPI